MELDEKYQILTLIENHGFSKSQTLNGSPSKSTYFYDLLKMAQNIGISDYEIQKSYDIGYEKGIDKIKRAPASRVKRIKK